MASRLICDIVNDAVAVESKQAKLLEIWPSLFVDLIKDIVIEMKDKEHYMESRMKMLEAT